MLRSDWCTLHLSLSQAMPPSESGQSEAVLQDRCNSVDLPSTYKVKVCKFCRASSWTKSPLPPGIFTHWDPLLPWSQGRRDKPMGFMCKICVSVLGSQSVRQHDLFCFVVANDEITQWLDTKHMFFFFGVCTCMYLKLFNTYQLSILSSGLQHYGCLSLSRYSRQVAGPQSAVHRISRV